ncbi:MAG: META domain-containing protein [Thermoanaerobaculia bacterium]
MERTSGIGFLAAALLISVSCAASPAAQEKHATAAPIENSEWRLMEVRNRKVTAPPGRASTLQLLAEGRRAVGNGGCNRFGGTYTLEGARMRFGALVSTKMFCEGVMEQEQAFLDALSATMGYRIEGDDLELLGPDGALARLQARSER